MSLKKALGSLFHKISHPRGRIWKKENHQYWGDGINWENRTPGQESMYGHTTPRVSLNDIIQCKMKSGKIGEYQVIKISYPGDPPDMWFANVEFIGYTEGGRLE